MLDLDPQGNATSGLGIDKYAEAHNIYQVLIGQTDINNVPHATKIEVLDIIENKNKIIANV